MANLQLDDSHKAVIGGKSTTTGNAVSIHAIPVGSVNALTIAIVDGSGNQITSFGGGTQYTTGSAEATPVGTVALGWDGTDVKALPLDNSGYLKVNVAAGSSGNAAASATGSAVPADADYIGFKDGSGNLTGVTIGQQTAANSIPVILPSATITTLTPPSNTGYALDSSLSTIDTDLKSNITLHSGTNTIGSIKLTDGTNTVSILSANSNNMLKVALYTPDGTALTQSGGDLLVNVQNFAVGQFGNQDANAANLTSALSINYNEIYNGTSWDRWKSGGVTGAAAISGDTASGSSDAGNPVKVGGLAKTSLPTAVSDGQRVGQMHDKFGRQVVLPVTIRDLTGTQTTTISNSTTETTIVTAASSTFNDVLMLVISNTSGSPTRIDFRDTTGGSVLFSLYAPANDTRGFSLGGVAIPQTSVNTNWTAQCATAVTDIRIYAVFAKNK